MNNLQRIKKYEKYKWIIIIFLIALIVRIIFVFSMPIKLWDETVYANLGYDLSKNFLSYSFSNGWSDFIPSNGDIAYDYPKAGFRAPLLPYLLSIIYFFKLDFFIDFFMPLIGAISAILVHFLGKELFNEETGLISALFFALIPLHVFYSSRVLTGVLSTLFILLSFLSFWKGYEQGNKKYKILFGVFLGLSLLARYTILWVIPTFLIYLLLRDKSFKFLKDIYLWCAILIFFIILGPWLIYGIHEYNTPIGAFIHGAKAATNWGGLQPWYFFFNNWWQIFSIIGLIFIIALIYIFYKREFYKKEIYLLLIWFSLFLGLAIYMPHKEERFILPITPVITLISGYFMSKIPHYKKLLIILVIFMLLLSLNFNFRNTFNLYHNINTECFKEIVFNLQEINGTFKVVSENPPLFRYSIKQENAYYPDNLNENTIKEITNLSKKPVYFVFTRFNSGFETEKWKNLKKIMEKNYKLKFNCSEDPEVNWIYMS